MQALPTRSLRRYSCAITFLVLPWLVASPSTGYSQVSSEISRAETLAAETVPGDTDPAGDPETPPAILPAEEVEEPSVDSQLPATSSAPGPDLAKLETIWEQSLRPLLVENCFECHRASEHSGQLELETIASLLRGGLSGPAIDPQSVEQSLLLTVLLPDAVGHMPPEGQLTDAEIELVQGWLTLFASASLPEDWLDSPSPTSPTQQKQDGETTGQALQRLPLGLNPSQVIDLATEAAWQANELQPTKLTSDASFVRRVYLDLVGRIPTQQERANYLASTAFDKREQLVDQLLGSDEHASHLATVLDAILIGRTSDREVKRRQSSGWFDFLTHSIAENRPWNEVAQAMLEARPQTELDRGAVWYLYSRKDKHQDIAEAISKDLFGVQIDCAQCHDHPLADEIKQAHYWGLVAFFNRSTNVDTPQGPRIAEAAIGGFSEFANLRGQSSPNRLVFLQTEPLPEARPAEGEKEEERDDLYEPHSKESAEPKVPKFSRRKAFVEEVFSGHPLVAKAMVNRMWGWMLGRGLVHPVNALDSFHPASHPELLDWLARDFEHSNYNLRRLLRSMALSRTYQLDSSLTASSDPKWFTSALAKPLTAESLYQSFQVALDLKHPEHWDTLDRKTAFANLFPDVLAEESLSNVSQGLWLTNGPQLQEMASVEHSNTLSQVSQLSETREVVTQLFVKILGRHPTDEEVSECTNYLEASPSPSSANPAPDQSSALTEKIERPPSPRVPPPQPSSQARQLKIEGLAWALLTSAEFRFNH
ncbi:DUF1553 domain-containing protein [Aureliella helgolandensis]|uniref:Planctomycete cytochrome C n=1 Tax=Aureliella helgolandensis TaxID=2527968 RepID=A0A518G1C1_9BACT|nr:DUF1553 domain-containing protein [Aureliella helgolandensis]QDV22392.1 Planctomycete cytochrome C [Aureliella helgolandensis]